MSNEKKPGCLGYIGDEQLPMLYTSNHRTSEDDWGVPITSEMHSIRFHYHSEKVLRSLGQGFANIRNPIYERSTTHGK